MREIQVPLLAVLLLGACAAKARRVLSARSVSAGTGPTAIFPVGLRRPAAIGLCAAELSLGLGLLCTTGAGTPALVFRVAATLLFGTAVGALYELRVRRPDAGCGCFGELSRTPVNWRVITRAVLLGAAALATVGAPPLRLPGSAGQAWLVIAAAVAELAALTALSPEVGQALIRLSHSEPCELREVPVARTLTALHASPSWRRYQEFLTAAAPSDVWREGCWRFVVFPGLLARRPTEVVFAVYLAGRRPPVRVGLVDADLGRPAAGPRRQPPAGALQMSNRL
jgi:hypothetical protein